MGPMEARSFMADHVRERWASLLAPAVSPTTASLAASVVPPSSVVRLGASSLILVRAPAIPLVLCTDLLEGLVHGERNLLDGKSLCNWWGTCN